MWKKLQKAKLEKCCGGLFGGLKVEVEHCQNRDRKTSWTFPSIYLPTIHAPLVVPHFRPTLPSLFSIFFTPFTTLHSSFSIGILSIYFFSPFLYYYVFKRK